MIEKFRVQFDFTIEAYNELQALKERLRASSRAEAVRIALGVLRWVLEQHSAGNKILVEKQNGDQQEVVFPFPKVEATTYSVKEAKPAAAAQETAGV